MKNLISIILFSTNLFSFYSWGQTACSNCPGKSYTQSPIDLTGTTSCSSNPLIPNLGTGTLFNIRTDTFNADLNNTGYTSNVILTPIAGQTTPTVDYNGTTYSLSQIHMHSSSEHTINGKTYGFEIHMVFVNGGNNLVIALLGNWVKGIPNPATLSQADVTTYNIVTYIWMYAIYKYATNMNFLPVPLEINLGAYQASNFFAGYDTYCGSLTTPTVHGGSTYSGPVTWIVCGTIVQSYSKGGANPLTPYSPAIIEGAKAIQTNSPKQTIYKIGN